MIDPNKMIIKAIQACASARLLLGSEDADGACNRAYYAMFDAARAVLVARGHDASKTHTSLINAFSKHFVKEGLVSKEIGRFLNRGEETRLIADYKDIPISLEDARSRVEEAETFVATIRTLLTPSFEIQE